MTIQELRQLDFSKLSVALRKVRHDLAVARFHVRTGKEQNTAKVKSLGKTVARILTLLRQLRNSK